MLFLRLLLAGITHRCSLCQRQPSSAATSFINTSIDDETIKPGREFRVAAKLANGSEQLQKDLLGNVFGDRAVAGGIDGYREYLVFISFEEELKRGAIAMLAGFDDASVNELFSHYHC